MVEVKSLYICSICKSEYKHRYTAEFCEASKKLKPCPVVVGQKIWVKERYGYGDERPRNKQSLNWGSDLIEEIYIGSRGLLKIIELNHTEDKVKELLKEACREHIWIIHTKYEHRMGKDDDSYTNEITLPNIETTPNWLLNNVEVSDPESKFLKNEWED